jgi:hypothetical protein
MLEFVNGLNPSFKSGFELCADSIESRILAVNSSESFLSASALYLLRSSAYVAISPPEHMRQKLKQQLQLLPSVEKLRRVVSSPVTREVSRSSPLTATDDFF